MLLWETSRAFVCEGFRAVLCEIFRAKLFFKAPVFIVLFFTTMASCKKDFKKTKFFVVFIKRKN